MRIIFLDFDGVLNSREFFIANRDLIRGATSFLQRGIAELNSESVRLMSDFAQEMNAGVVISSSWRTLHSLGEINEMLIQTGWQTRLPFSVTPRDKHGFRGNEIIDWLSDFGMVNVESFVIFDDDGDFHPSQPLIRTSWDFGLQQQHIDIARNILLTNINL